MKSRLPNPIADGCAGHGFHLAAKLAAAAVCGMSLLTAGPAQAAGGVTHGRAVAQKGPPGNMCIMALQASGKLAIGSLSVSGVPDVCLASSPNCPSYPAAYECDVYNDSQASDSTDIGGGASISARNYHLSGGYDVSSNAAMYHTGEVGTYVPAVPDPYANYQIPSNDGDCEQSGTPPVGWAPATSMTITPYSSTEPYVICGGLTVNAGITLTLEPGIYIIDGGNLTVNGGATLNGTGVQIILTNDGLAGSKAIYGTVTINGNGSQPANVNVSAPTSGPTSGVAFWVDKNAPFAKNVFNGGTTQIINGAIYAPTQEVDYSGGSSAGTNCSQLVALTIKFSSNPYFKHNCQGAGVLDPAGPPRLVE